MPFAVIPEPQLEEGIEEGLGIEEELDFQLLFSWIRTILKWFLYFSKMELKTLFYYLIQYQIIPFLV